ncbi:MAG: magnesium protoporphyrin IX methyltransferase [Leptothrix sp. (in: b-proteobacteria)]
MDLPFQRPPSHAPQRAAPQAMPATPTTLRYAERRGEIETYFDRTAVEAWARLTSTAPVGRIRATVRAGRDRMRHTLLSWLPDDLRGVRLLDAGCGTGALAVEAARRGADVVAIDLSVTLVDLARERAPADLAGRIRFLSGDMLDPALGRFDHVVAMDSLIHYEPADCTRVLDALAARCNGSIAFTYAPSNFALAAFRAVGRAFPRGERAPWIVPVKEAHLRELRGRSAQLCHWQEGRTQRIASGFYTSQALELLRP